MGLYNQNLILIALAPENKTFTVFCLTNIGLQEIGKCKKPGFHKHREDDKRFDKEAKHMVDVQTCETLL